MINYKKYFKNKKITIMGLGLLGRSIAYTKFLAECGALLTVTDLKSRDMLASSIKLLSKYRNPEGKGTSYGAGIKFVLGEHRLIDFQNADMVIKSAGVPLDSIYTKEAIKNKIPIEMDASLFAKLAPEVTIIGVTGTRGKTMTTMLIYEILKESGKALKRKVYAGGNIRGGATLPLLSKVKAGLPAQAGDIVVLELDSWQLQGFGDAKISPQISVFTSFMPDHMNYYKDNMKKYFEDKANIFKYQKKGDILVICPDMKKLIPKSLKSKLIVINKKNVESFDFAVPGEHQRENLACAVEVAKQFNIPISNIKKVVKNFKGVEGRLQYIKTVKGVKIYNDNNATTPEATISGLEALGGKKKNIILIAGGADKGLDVVPLVKAIDKYCKAVVLLAGTGTDELLSSKQKVVSVKANSLNEAVSKSVASAKKGDIILFSPAFASFGMFTNEYDRNDKFLEIIKKLR